MLRGGKLEAASFRHVVVLSGLNRGPRSKGGEWDTQPLPPNWACTIIVRNQMYCTFNLFLFRVVLWLPYGMHGINKIYVYKYVRSVFTMST